MLAIIKRELRAYFQTPIGFLFTGLFLLFTGFFFFFDNLLQARSEFSGFLGSTLLICLFAVPILMMRSLDLSLEEIFLNLTELSATPIAKEGE